MSEKLFPFKVNIEGLTIHGTKYTISVFPEIDNVENSDYLDRKVYWNYSQYCNLETKDCAVIDMSFQVYNGSLEKLIINFHTNITISRYQESINEEKDGWNLTNWALGLVQDYIIKNNIKDKAGNLLFIGRMRSAPFEFKGFIGND